MRTFAGGVRLGTLCKSRRSTLVFAPLSHENVFWGKRCKSRGKKNEKSFKKVYM